MHNIDKFIKKLNKTYDIISIYRAFIIVKYKYEAIIIINKLKKFNFDPIYIDNSDINKNYRLYVLLLENVYIIDNIDKNDYNFIAFMI